MSGESEPPLDHHRPIDAQSLAALISDRLDDLAGRSEFSALSRETTAATGLIDLVDILAFAETLSPQDNARVRQKLPLLDIESSWLLDHRAESTDSAGMQVLLEETGMEHLLARTERWLQASLDPDDQSPYARAATNLMRLLERGHGPGGGSGGDR